MARHSLKDPRTGRWMKVPLEGTPLAQDSKFDVMRELEVQAQGADPRDLAYDLTDRDESNVGPKYAAPKVADNLGVSGSPLRSRNPTLVSENEQAETEYGSHLHGQVGRVAASRGPRNVISGTNVEMDASRRVTGAGE